LRKKSYGGDPADEMKLDMDLDEDFVEATVLIAALKV